MAQYIVKQSHLGENVRVKIGPNGHIRLRDQEALRLGEDITFTYHASIRKDERDLEGTKKDLVYACMALRIFKEAREKYKGTYRVIGDSTVYIISKDLEIITMYALDKELWAKKEGLFKRTGRGEVAKLLKIGKSPNRKLISLDFDPKNIARF